MTIKYANKKGEIFSELAGAHLIISGVCAVLTLLWGILALPYVRLN